MVGPVNPIDVALADASGCILADDVTATMNVPRADAATTDGYAVAASDIAGASELAPVELPVVDDASIGTADPMRLVPGGSVRIMSGAPVPAGADVVVPMADTDRGVARVLIRSVPLTGTNIRPVGVDVQAGERLLPAGTRLGARQLSLVAASGYRRVRVHPRPRVVVISIGDELIEPGITPKPGQVFDSNGIALSTAALDAGADVFQIGVVPDERARLRETLEDQLVRADLIMTTGGLSEGIGDTVREVLEPLGTVEFHEVAMFPGSMQGLGILGDGEAERLAGAVDHTDIYGDGRPVPVFALPGSPVGAYISFEMFVRPALRKMAGYAELFRPSVTATVARGWCSPSGKREFVRALLSGDPINGYAVEPVGDVDEPLLSALARANALAVIPEDVPAIGVGDIVPCVILEES